MSAMDYETEPRPYDDEPRGYDRERSRSPRPDRRGDSESRARSASPNGRDRMDTRTGPPPADRGEDDNSRNPGSNLFVTGIHPRLSEAEVTRMFEKYGEVEKCNIMRDPHTRESRGFGFVKMVTPEGADAAKDGLQGEVIEGRTLSIEKARRSRPRTPTPGKYFGPPKREDRPRGGGRFGGGRERDYDRRGGDYGRRDEYRGSRYGGGDRYDDRREYGGRGYGRDDAPRNIDRYGGGAGGRDDRYGREDRGYGGSRYGGDDRTGGAPGTYGGERGAPKEGREAYGSRPYGGGGDDDRYARR